MPDKTESTSDGQDNGLPPKPDLKTAAEKRIWAMWEREVELRKEFEKRDPGDYVLAQMLLSIEIVRDGMAVAKEQYDKSTDMKIKMAFLGHQLNMTKQHSKLLNELIKYQEKQTTLRKKTKAKTRSAAPGQQIGVSILDARLTQPVRTEASETPQCNQNTA